jgi:hypothetical protein
MTHKLQEKPPVLNREHSALQNMEIFYFFHLWVIFALLDPDLDPAAKKLMQIHADPYPLP